jgi:hypothetical protein
LIFEDEAKAIRNSKRLWTWFLLFSFGIPYSSSLLLLFLVLFLNRCRSYTLAHTYRHIPPHTSRAHTYNIINKWTQIIFAPLFWFVLIVSILFHFFFFFVVLLLTWSDTLLDF